MPWARLAARGSMSSRSGSEAWTGKAGHVVQGTGGVKGRWRKGSVVVKNR